ncbi:MAG: glycosyltransferase [Chloroflexi bacterium]|nr:glycosyltransferase [Chloroflexota bacterium]
MNRPLHVLELTAGVAIGDPLGGAARFVVELARAFDQKKVVVHLASIWSYQTEAEAHWQTVLRAEGISHSFAARWEPTAPLSSCVQGLRGLWRSLPFRPEIIHSHGEFTDLAAILLKRHLGARHLIRTRHNIVEWPKRPALGRLFGHWLHPFFFDAEVAVSQQASAALEQRWLARRLRRRSETLYNAIDFRRFAAGQDVRQALRTQLGLPTTARILGTVGSLVKRKGYDTLLLALAELLPNHPDLHLVLVGDGPERPWLAALCAELGLQPHVHFLGAQNHIEAILPGFDLFVSSSLVEGLPTVLLESIAAGLPIVATDIAGTNEILQQGVTGRLVPAQNPQALAAAIAQVWAAPAETQAMIQRAAISARERFAIAQVAAQYTRLFQHLTLADQ